MELIIKLTDQEANAVKALLHIATQARGLEVAEAALHISRKLESSAKAAVEAQKTIENTVQNNVNRIGENP